MGVRDPIAIVPVLAIGESPRQNQIQRMGPALWDALRWLDAYRHFLSPCKRHAITSSIPQWGLPSSSSEIDFADEIVRCHGWKVFLSGATTVVVQTTTGWFNPHRV